MLEETGCWVWGLLPEFYATGIVCLQFARRMDWPGPLRSGGGKVAMTTSVCGIMSRYSDWRPTDKSMTRSNNLEHNLGYDLDELETVIYILKGGQVKRG